MEEIKKISQETTEAIKRKSAYSLPDRPTDVGMRASEIKQTFYAPITDESVSVISEVNRIVEEVNNAFDDTSAAVDTEITNVKESVTTLDNALNDKMDSHINNTNNPHFVTKAQVGLASVNDTSDLHKPVSGPQKTYIDTGLSNHDTNANAHAPLRTEINKKVNISDVVNDVCSDDTIKPLSAKQGKVLKTYVDDLESNKVAKLDIVDTLTSQETLKPLSANMGKSLNDKVKPLVKDIVLGDNGILTITKQDGTNTVIDLPIEYMIKSGTYNVDTKNIELVCDNGDKILIPAGDLIDVYYADDTTLELYKNGSKWTFKVSDTLRSEIADNTLSRHTHSNKNILDLTTESFTSAVKTKYDLYETAIEKNTEVSHTHENKTLLDETTESFTTELKAKYDAYKEQLNELSISAGANVVYKGTLTTIGALGPGVFFLSREGGGSAIAVNGIEMPAWIINSNGEVSWSYAVGGASVNYHTSGDIAISISSGTLVVYRL